MVVPLACVAFAALSVVGAAVVLVLVRLQAWLGAGTRRTRPRCCAPPPQAPPAASVPAVSAAAVAAATEALGAARDTVAAAGRLVGARARVRTGGRRSAVVGELERVRAQLAAAEARAVRAAAADPATDAARAVAAVAAEEHALAARSAALAAQLAPLLVHTPALDAALFCAQQHAKALVQRARAALGGAAAAADAPSPVAAELARCESALAGSGNGSDFAAACLAAAAVPRALRETLAGRAEMPCTRSEERARCAAACRALRARAAAHRAEAARLRADVAAATARLAAARAAHPGLRERHDAQCRALAAARAAAAAAVRARVDALRRDLAAAAATDPVAVALGQPPVSPSKGGDAETHAFLAGVRAAVAVQAHHEEALLRACGVGFEPRADMFVRRAPAPRVDAVVERLARPDVLDDADVLDDRSARVEALLERGCAPSQVPEALAMAAVARRTGVRPRASSLVAVRAAGPGAAAVPRVVAALVAKATAQCGAPALRVRLERALLAVRIAARRERRAATADDLAPAERALLAATCGTPAVHAAARAPLPAALRARPLVCEHVPRLLTPLLWPVPLDRARRFAPAVPPGTRVPRALAGAARQLWAEVLLADDPKAPKRYPHLYDDTAPSSITSRSSGHPLPPRTRPGLPPPPPAVVRRPGPPHAVALPGGGVLGSPPTAAAAAGRSAAALGAWLDGWLRRLAPARRRQLLLHLRYVARANYTARRAVLVRLARAAAWPSAGGSRAARAVRRLLAARLLLALRDYEDRTRAARTTPYLGPEYRDCGTYYYLPGAWPGADDPLAAAREMPHVAHSLVPWTPLFAHSSSRGDRPAATALPRSSGSSSSSGDAPRAVPLWERARDMRPVDRLRLVWHIARAVRASRVAAQRRLRETVDALRALE